MSIEPSEKVRLTRKNYPTLKELKLAVLRGEYHQGISFFSRSFLWRTVCLNTYKLEILEDEMIPLPSAPALKPEEDTSAEKSHTKTPAALKVSTHDPLTSSTSQTSILNSEEQNTLDVIRMDVDRLLIDPIFQDEEVKKDIIQIMYNYNFFTPYKQGFHEICGIIYLQLHTDDPNNANIKTETFNIFTALMISVVPNFYNEDNLIGWCISVFNKDLLLIDPALYELLIKKHKIESQIWLIRWVRLIFLRELGQNNTLKLLDLLLCYDHDLCKLFPFLIIILLVKIKLQLAECEDNGEVLYLLLHYPHNEMSIEEIKELVDYSVKLYNIPEDKLGKAGETLNKKFHGHVRWEKIMDLDRLRMEMKLQRRVRGALKKK